MKTSSTKSFKKSKTFKKSKSCQRSSMYGSSQGDGASKLRTLGDEEEEDINWAFEDKNEKELKAINDLCALSEERYDNVQGENEIQQAWVESPKIKKRNVSPVLRTNLELLTPKRAVTEEDRNEIKTEEKRDGLMSPSQPEAERNRQSRNFVKENMRIRPRISREQDIKVKDQMGKFPTEPTAEILSTIRDIKEDTLIQSIDDNLTMSQGFFQGKSLPSGINLTREMRESLSGQYEHFDVIKLERKWENTQETEEQKRRRLIHASLDFKATNASRYTRPRTGTKSWDKLGSATSYSQEDINKLMKKLERTLMQVEPEKIRSNSELRSRLIKKRQRTGRGDISANREGGMGDSRASVNLRPDEKFFEMKLAEQKELERRQLQARLFFKLKEEEEKANKMLKAQESRKRDEQIEKVHQIKNAKGNKNNMQSLKGLEIHFLISKELSLPSESFEKKTSIVRSYNANKLRTSEASTPSGNAYIRSSMAKNSSGSNTGTGVTVSNLDDKKTTVKVFKNIFKKPIVETIQKECGDNLKQLEKFEKLELQSRTPESYKIHSRKADNWGLGGNIDSKQAKVTSPIKFEGTAISPNFREATLNNMQKSPKIMFLKGVGRKVNS